jgi:hypothetical protein
MRLDALNLCNLKTFRSTYSPQNQDLKLSVLLIIFKGCDFQTCCVTSMHVQGPTAALGAGRVRTRRSGQDLQTPHHCVAQHENVVYRR